MTMTSTTEQLLMDLNKGKKVSRWEVMRNRPAIKLFLQEEKYKHLTEQVNDLLESAKESL